MKEFAQKIIEKRLIHYLVAGGTAFVVEYGSFLVFYYGLHMSAVIANTISFILGLATSFTLNRFWVFGHKKQNRRVSHQLSIYAIVGGANLLITDTAIHYMVHAGIPAFIDKILLVMLVACWNFVIFKKFIFAHKPEDELV
jgi:putative flippase GtrA